MVRDRDMSHLHPAVRVRIEELLAALSSENLPFRVFEGFRSPQRQQYLYDQGRSRPGSIVTRARPWSSYHQYGVAADFVLFIDDRWSWDTAGERAGWWDRLHELARIHGLQPLSWELPHLQMAGVSLSDLQQGRYPTEGDASWAQNLGEAIYSWTGEPAAPPLPAELQERPPLAQPAVSPEQWAACPQLGSADWHNMYDGREWRYDASGVYTRDVDDGRQPLRTPGEPVTCRRIIEVGGEALVMASCAHQVPVPILMMTIATETRYARSWGFTGPMTFRWEPGVKVSDVSPAIWGDYSAGPMQTLATTARWIVRSLDLEYDPFQVAPVYERCPEPPREHPLYDHHTSIDIGAATIRKRWPSTGDDPILVAAAYNAGGHYKSARNPWRLRCTGDHLDRAARWFGDACAVLTELIGE